MTGDTKATNGQLSGGHVYSIDIQSRRELQGDPYGCHTSIAADPPSR
ncbi:MAG: hypothetical protein ACYDHH_24605 [Solirubrobacteraceae bacterium]